MLSIAESLLVHTPLGGTSELPRAGTALENPFVYGAAAREMEEHARRGRVEIVDEVRVPMGGFGELRLGRDKVPTNLTWDEFDPFRDSGVGRSSRLSAARGIGSYAFSRANNAVGYLTPAMGGFFGQAMVAAGENTSGNKYAGLRGGYRAGPLVAAFTYASADSTSGDDAAIWSLGGTYDFKSFKLWGFYNAVDDVNAGQSNWLLGTTLPVGGFELRASYQAMSGDEGISDQDADMFAIGAVYNLSKRTALYATYSAISNTNTSFTVASGGPLTKGNDSSGYEFGIRHSF